MTYSPPTDELEPLQILYDLGYREGILDRIMPPEGDLTTILPIHPLLSLAIFVKGVTDGKRQSRGETEKRNWDD